MFGATNPQDSTPVWSPTYRDYIQVRRSGSSYYVAGSDGRPIDGGRSMSSDPGFTFDKFREYTGR